MSHYITRRTSRGRTFVLLAGSALFVAGVLLVLMNMSAPTTTSVAQPSSSVQVVTPRASQFAITPPTSSAALEVTKPPTQVAVPVPLKAAPTRLVVPSAGIDTPIDRLPMSAEQVAQRIYEAPLTTSGYWAQFSENGTTYYDVPGRDMIHATLIIGHSCTDDACYTEDGELVSQSEWQFAQLSNPDKVHTGTKLSVFTANGEVCAGVLTVHKVGRYDAAAQDVVLQDAARQRYIVINTCDTLSGADGIATLVVAKTRSCGA